MISRKLKLSLVVAVGLGTGLCVQAAVLPSYSIVAPFWQEDTPVQIASIGTSVTYFVCGALVFNSSDEEISHIRLGFMLDGESDGSGGVREGQIYISGLIGVYLQPGQNRMIGALDWMTHEILSAAIASGFERFIAEVGIVQAVSTSGRSVYSYDLPSKGTFAKVARGTSEHVENLFQSMVDSGVVEEFEDAVARQAELDRSRWSDLAEANPLYKPINYLTEASRSVAFQGGPPTMCCKNSATAYAYCSVGTGGSSCTVSACSQDCIRNNEYPCQVCCACQVCSIVPDCG